MAKGNRSKVKRRNRTALRANVMEPIQNKRQKEISEAIKRDISEKSSLGSLASKLKPQTNFTAAIDMNVENEISITSNPEEVDASKKKPNKKPIKNSTKVLTWF